MRAVVTRVSSASVKVDGVLNGEIKTGFLVLVGIKPADTPKDAEKLAHKICSLRVFSDEEGRLNRSLSDAGGELLVVSNFTLYASCVRGRRPDFAYAAGADIAHPLYDYFVECCKNEGFPPKTGVFGGDMEVESVNDGPVTLVIESEELK